MDRSTNGALAATTNTSAKTQRTQRSSFRSPFANSPPEYHSETTKSKYLIRMELYREEGSLGKIMETTFQIHISQIFKWVSSSLLLCLREAMFILGVSTTLDSLEMDQKCHRVSLFKFLRSALSIALSSL